MRRKIPTKTDNVTEAIDIIFKMRQDGRMDKEEAGLLLDVIFSGKMDRQTFWFIRFIYKVRPYDDSWSLEEDGEGWETIADFTDLPGGGIPIKKLLKLLKKLEGK